ncbi:gas vesicle protein [Streptomyces sp. Z26]|uniref:gas vesicle protein GvpO n=1 Tax=Streptomyces TaxID=1883 RepID=UPI000EF16B88|nr:gas vesicle protein [Streptomyces sp. Z26]RLL66067.1 gas vesicle protein [Streptomyces sp. Z26]
MGTSDGDGTAERASAPEAMRSAARQLAELIGSAPDSVSSLQPADDGWTAHVEVVEIERIPETTSVMASYRVDLDPSGQLLGYERVRRYSRGQTDRESRR